MRKLLKSILNKQTVDDESLQTLMFETEAIINDRPTTSDDLNDLEALTCNRLLLLKRQLSLPPGLFEKEDLYSRRGWKQVQYLADLFWKQWVHENKKGWLRFVLYVMVFYTLMPLLPFFASFPIVL